MADNNKSFESTTSSITGECWDPSMVADSQDLQADRMHMWADLRKNNEEIETNHVNQDTEAVCIVQLPHQVAKDMRGNEEEPRPAVLSPIMSSRSDSTMPPPRPPVQPPFSSPMLSTNIAPSSTQGTGPTNVHPSFDPQANGSLPFPLNPQFIYRGDSSRSSNDVSNHTLLVWLENMEEIMGKKVDEILTVVKNLQGTTEMANESVAEPNESQASDVETASASAAGTSGDYAAAEYEPNEARKITLCEKLTVKEIQAFAHLNEISLNGVRGKKEMAKKVHSLYAKDKERLAFLHMKLSKDNLISIYKEEGTTDTYNKTKEEMVQTLYPNILF